MKINQIHQVSKAYETTAARKMPVKNEKINAKDKVEISETAKYFQIALKAAKDSPDIREEKVAKIKAQIESGTYSVSATEVADKMMAEFFDHSI